MNVVSPTPAAAPYWDFIKDSSDEVKLNLITLLSMSIEEHMLPSPKEDTTLAPYTIQEVRDRLAKSEREYERGDFYTQEEAHQMMEQFVLQKTQTA